MKCLCLLFIVLYLELYCLKGILFSFFSFMFPCSRKNSLEIGEIENTCVEIPCSLSCCLGFYYRK